MASPSETPQGGKASLSLFYYGLVVIASTAMALALYNIIIAGYCSQCRLRQLRSRSDQSNSSQRSDNLNSNLIPTFKYRREGMQEQTGSDKECAICLTGFEDGEDLRQLQPCKHSFHASCIDMWLYSHSDCPLCRATVVPLVSITVC